MTKTENHWSAGPPEHSFNCTRLTAARERRGLTKQGLAELCNVSRRAVSAWEAGEVDSPPIGQLARILDLPTDFFYADDAPQIEEGWVTFRALSTMTARQVRRILSLSSLGVEFSGWVDRRYGTPGADLPDFSEVEGLSPSATAERLRSAWSLHLKPIKNMVTLLERKGVRVFSIPTPDREIDSFAFRYEGRPFTFLNLAKTAERIRFDSAHELGHLLLHKDSRRNRSRQVEQEAQDFASSFLMPADGLYAQVIGKLRLADVFTLKKYWKVSAVAMVERLYHLEFISEWVRRQWIIELSQLGYRVDEPDGIPQETSRFFGDVFRLAREDGWSLRKIAADLKDSEKDLDALVFGLAISSIDGGGRSAPAVHGHLSLVQ
ncbi:ImmA/IrrE family metallo-endopeptidase [Streptomyces sp. PT12]|uniref:helix-turn-helix domain-containing protein n=1 Tax=Streptomyces sp. PT12 TaxID=1510197 RepID=UPI000DF98792|nr:XRE family transcriptional regulator [Streptomyces sp. PT12]RBM22859.1 XRE family transcriptional regulator [Streptomyces sp. PT12]